VHDILTRNVFLVKEHVGMFKAASNYDIFDPNEPQQPIMLCREPNLGIFSKMFRFTDYKRMTPFDIHVTTPSGDPVLKVQRGVSLFLSKVDVFNESGVRMGGFKQKFFSMTASFNVLGPNDEVLCNLKGSWRGREFKFEKDGKVYAEVKQKWAGMAKELFTTADTYAVSISEDVTPDNPIRVLILGAVLCIDMVLKE
jgi:uncharacterized protein YxjI